MVVKGQEFRVYRLQGGTSCFGARSGAQTFF